MSVIHVLADGSRPTDITGHIVRLDDARSLYSFLHNVNRKQSQPKKFNNIRKDYQYERNIV